jgi:hypothetical protein
VYDICNMLVLDFIQKQYSVYPNAFSGYKNLNVYLCLNDAHWMPLLYIKVDFFHTLLTNSILCIEWRLINPAIIVIPTKF